MELVKYPDERLLKKCVEVTEPDIELAEGMAKIMIENRGIGLAAPQVGSDKRLILVAPKVSEDIIAMYNPVITRTGKEDEEAWEGCLSFPGKRKIISRKAVITVDFMDIDGNQITEVFKRLPARIIQHEIDHLDGILCMDIEEVKA